MKYTIIALILSALFFSCDSFNSPDEKKVEKIKEAPSNLDIYLNKIKLPPGFHISAYAKGVAGARSMSRSPNGTLFVGTREAGKVYALRDEDGDFYAEKKYILAEGLNMPNGVAFKNGDLYVAEINRILKYKDIENHLGNPPGPEIIYDRYPKDKQHGWKYIAFGPDGKLYVPVGAPCNICEPGNKIYASITRLDLGREGGAKMEVVQHGIRNTVGFTWHPRSGKLWFTDNGADNMGDDLPACELNYAPEKNMHFGFPYCHQGDLPDPRFGNKRECREFIPPAKKLDAHVAPLGLEFYKGDMFPKKYKHQILIAEHGSWNRSKKSGYRVMLVQLNGNKAISYEPFAEGWLNEKNGEVWGRPVDLEHLPDGSILVSDDFADLIYRIYYQEGF